MSVIDNFFEMISDGLTELIKNTVGDVVKSARDDANKFLDDSRTKLTKWVTQLSNGQLDQWEFEFLVGSQKDLAKMHALKALGIAMTKIERFKEGLISLIINSALSVVRV